nr:MAPK kinase substrate protein At1g80180-like [Nicotiana tomentosiformis]
MTTLQRSSSSFRRQGSSGRIWDNRLNTTADGGPPTTTAHGIGNSQKYRRIQFDEVSNVATTSVGTETNKNSYAAATSEPSSRSKSSTIMQKETFI